MPAKLTEAIIKQRLIDSGRTISLVWYAGKVRDNTSRWRCHDCGHEWNSDAGNILSGKGCRPCGRTRTTNRQRLSKEDIKQRLIDNNRTISLVRYGNNVLDGKSRWCCHDCDYEWLTSISSILNNGSGCPACYGKIPLTPEVITQRLIDNDRPITLLSYGNGSHDNSSLWKCHICDYDEWRASASSILSGFGCPSCYGNIPLTPEAIAQKLIDDDRPITLLSYGNHTNDNSSRWCCHACDHEWLTSSNSILRGSGCPSCNPGGFNPGKPGYAYLHTFNGFIKIGITNIPEKRHEQLDNQLINETLHTIKSTMSWYFEDGAEAKELESTILDMFKQHSYTKLLETAFAGKTELFENAAHQEILDYIKDNYDIRLV